MSVSNVRTSMAAALLLILAPLVQALQRTVGNPKDIRTQTVVDKCFSESTPSSPIGFQYGSCAALIICVSSQLDADISSGLQSGGTIASLLPTILALVGVPTRDIFELTLTSPHRALATCIFGINLPKGLFSQLRKNDQSSSDNSLSDNSQSEDSQSETKLQRSFYVRVPTTKSKMASVRKALFLDFSIVGIAAIMVWRHAVVASQTMVTWRCEYSFLVLVWPIACAVWLIIVYSLLHIFKSKIEIKSPDNKLQSRIALLLLPYRRGTTTSPTQAGPPPDSRWTVTVTMRCANGWAWFETIAETLAAGIYLYATFVLSSLLYLSGQEAIIYATVMVLGQSAIRVLETM